MRYKPDRKLRIWVPLWATGLYLVLALVWVYVSSAWVFSLGDGELARLLETVKGWAFVVGSGLLFYALMRLGIRQQQAATEALERSEAHYRMLVENMADLVAELDENGTILYACDRYPEMFGPSQSHHPFRPIEELVEPVDWPKIAAALEKLRAPPHSALLELRMQTINGPRWIGWTLRRAPQAPRARETVIAAGRDVTERHESMATLQEINRLKNEFIATASHELRTPLTAVLGYLELLQSTPPGKLDESIRQEWMRYMQEGAETLKTRVEDLLDVSRLEQGHKLHLCFQECDLKKLLQRIADMYRPGHPRHTIVVAPLADEFTVWGDPERLLQVLENLMSNAVKYSPKGGEVRLGGQLLDGKAEITVQDYGIGMDKKQVTRIFERFYRADSSDTAIGGLGLGLTIALALVRAHSGDIDVFSKPGAGTSFTIRLPRYATGA